MMKFIFAAWKLSGASPVLQLPEPILGYFAGQIVLTLHFFDES